MFDTSFRWTLLKIGVIVFCFSVFIDMFLMNIFVNFLPFNVAGATVRLLIAICILSYIVIHPLISSFRDNKIIEDLTDLDEEPFFKRFLKIFGRIILILGLSSLFSSDYPRAVWCFEMVIGMCCYMAGSSRLEIRKKGLFTPFGLFSWELIESYDFNILGVVIKQKGWRKFFPVLLKVFPWQRSKLEKYLAELQPCIDTNS